MQDIQVLNWYDQATAIDLNLDVVSQERWQRLQYTDIHTIMKSTVVKSSDTQPASPAVRSRTSSKFPLMAAYWSTPWWSRWLTGSTSAGCPECSCCSSSVGMQIAHGVLLAVHSPQPRNISILPGLFWASVRRHPTRTADLKESWFWVGFTLHIFP